MTLKTIKVEGRATTKDTFFKRKRNLNGIKMNPVPKKSAAVVCAALLCRQSTLFPSVYSYKKYE